MAFRHYKVVVGDVIKVVGRVESDCIVIVLAKITDALGPYIRMVLPRHVVRYKIDDHFQPVRMCTGDEAFKFLHPVRHVHGQVGVHIVVILHCIGRACNAFYDQRVVGINAELRIIG